MTSEAEPKRHIIDSKKLPAQFSTHMHSSEFWEKLGRAVATFGFLEETLGKAIFAFTGTRELPVDQAQAAFEKWVQTLQHALKDPLGNLIDTYGKAVRDNSAATITNLDDLLVDLRAAAAMRNILCHGSWRTPDEQGRSVPFFVNKRDVVFETPMDIAYLQQVQQHVVELICAVINTVTHMGWQFPGSTGPGKPIV